MRWNPLREIEKLQNRVFNAPAPSMANGSPNTESTPWAPLVDIVEDSAEYLITAELLQVCKEDVKITLENGRLTVSGERGRQEEKDGRKVHRPERPYGPFFRTFALLKTPTPAR